MVCGGLDLTIVDDSRRLRLNSSIEELGIIPSYCRNLPAHLASRSTEPSLTDRRAAAAMPTRPRRRDTTEVLVAGWIALGGGHGDRVAPLRLPWTPNSFGTR